MILEISTGIALSDQKSKTAAFPHKLAININVTDIHYKSYCTHHSEKRGSLEQHVEKSIHSYFLLEL